MVQPKEEIIVSAIKSSLTKIPQYQQSLKDIDIYLDIPKDRKNGDLFTNICFRIAGIVKSDPLTIAKNVAELLTHQIKKSYQLRDIEKIEYAHGGYINFFFKNQYFYSILKKIIKEKDGFGRLNVGKKNKVLIEFVSANPTGPLSVAHARQAAIGDSLANLLSFLGYKLKREYYINDEGNQIVILARSVQARYKELKGEPFEFKDEYYKGDYIYDIAREINKKKLRCESIDSFGDFAVNYILQIIKKDLEDFGVRFDIWYSQKKSLKKKIVLKTIDSLRKKGFIYKEDGALWFKSTVFGDDKDRVVVKNNGDFTYLAPDIAYHKDKFKRGYRWLINIWGPDHHGYVKRLESAVASLGKDKKDLSILIIQLATIYKHGKPVSMSTRRGQYISLREVLDEVGSDAARFFFMMRKSSSHLDFDLDLAKRQAPENPVYYVQYAHARICSILNSAGNIRNFTEAKLELLKEPFELQLMRVLAEFPFVLQSCHKLLDPFGLTNYLQDIAKSFHKFYDLHRVLVEDISLRQARLALIYATKIILANGLRILGISAPEKM